MLRTRPLSDENVPNNLLMYPLLLKIPIYQMFGWIRVRLKELMPQLYRHGKYLSYITFCSPKIHDFLFMVYNCTKDLESKFYSTPVCDFIYLSRRVERGTHKASIALHCKVSQISS